MPLLITFMNWLTQGFLILDFPQIPICQIAIKYKSSTGVSFPHAIIC